MSRKSHLSRYAVLLTLAALMLAVLSLNHPSAAAQSAATAAATSSTMTAETGSPVAIPPFPSAPITLQIIDVGGQKQLVQGIINNYVKANPDKVSKIDIISDTAPNLPGRLKSQEDAGKLDTSMVLSGFDGVSSGIAQNLLLHVLPEYGAKFPNLDANYQDIPLKFKELARGYAVPDVYSPGGPLVEYDPSQVDTPPKTLDDLKTWIKANPNKFIYARPANSGPGRTFLMGLPYLLGDKDPSDPINGWDKTWAFLKEIDASIEYYPSRTGDVMAELGNGTRAMAPVQMGWDINPRVLGNVPADYKVAVLQGTTFVADDQFMLIPKGLDSDHLAVVLDLMAFMLKPDQQAITFDKGYFYPGPAVKGVDLSMAPADSQDVLKKFGRPEYDAWIKNTPIVLPLTPDKLVAAFAKWDKDIGGSKIKAASTAVPPTATKTS